MHISEGVLSAPVLIVGAGLTVVGTAIGLKKIDYDRIMTVAILSAAFLMRHHVKNFLFSSFLL